MTLAVRYLCCLPRVHAFNTHSGGRCEAERWYAQWWHAGLREGQHYVASHRPADLPALLGAALRAPDEAAAVARRGAEYTYHTLDPAFVLRYWHALLRGYAALHRWDEHPLLSAGGQGRGGQPRSRAPVHTSTWV